MPDTMRDVSLHQQYCTRAKIAFEIRTGVLSMCIEEEAKAHRFSAIRIASGAKYARDSPWGISRMPDTMHDVLID